MPEHDTVNHFHLLFQKLIIKTALLEPEVMGISQTPVIYGGIKMFFFGPAIPIYSRYGRAKHGYHNYFQL